MVDKRQSLQDRLSKIGNRHAEVAQLVERSPEEGDVTSSTLVLGTSIRKDVY
jgi:hypothetical protein